jgi:hypothetical protein
MSEDVQDAVDTPEVDTAVVAQETEAKRFGWVPKEEFSGDPESWRPADEFLKRGREINGFLRKDLEKIERENAQKAAEIAEMRATMEEFRKFHNETEQRAYKRALEELKAAKVEAIEQGDGAKVVEIDEEIETLKETKKTVETPPEKDKSKAQYDREYFEWAKDNQWYIVDPELKSLAEHFGEEVTKLTPNKKGKEFLDEVTRKVKEAAPEKFMNPNRSNATVGSSSDGRMPPSNKKSKSYANLPADAKAACDKFVKQKLMTVEQYVSEYAWD